MVKVINQSSKSQKENERSATAGNGITTVAEKQT